MQRLMGAQFFRAILLGWSVISAARAHPEILTVVGFNFNRAVMAVGLEIRRFVRYSILAAEFLLNLGKGVGHIANLERVKWTAAGCVGDPVENFVARAFGPAHVGADCVDDGLGALCHLDGLLARHVALVVIAVAEQT